MNHTYFCRFQRSPFQKRNCSYKNFNFQKPSRALYEMATFGRRPGQHPQTPSLPWGCRIRLGVGTCGVHVVCMWCACGVHVVGMWCACGVHVVGMWWACGGHVVCRWCACGVHVVCMWCAWGVRRVCMGCVSCMYVCMHVVCVCVCVDYGDDAAGPC